MLGSSDPRRRLRRAIGAFIGWCNRHPSIGRGLRRLSGFAWRTGTAGFVALRRRLQGPIARVPMHGGSMFVDLRDRGISHHLYWFHVYEPLETAWVTRLVPPGTTAIDLGANIGYYTLLLSKLVGEDGRVVAIEPSRRNADLLERSLAANRLTNVDVHRIAASDRDGVLELEESTANYGMDRLVRDPDGRRTNTEVQARRLDDVLAKISPPPSFVKLDIEGGELAALRGMSETLSRYPDMLLLVEINPSALEGCGTSASELADFLASQGFHPYRMTESRPVPDSWVELCESIETGRHINVLAARAAWHERLGAWP